MQLQLHERIAANIRTAIAGFSYTIAPTTHPIVEDHFWLIKPGIERG